MFSEFNIIQHYFTYPMQHTKLGIGDDAALINPGQGVELAISADMLVASTHFFHDADPHQLGWKSLAVSVSDMAAMGAQPKWATLAIAQALEGLKDADGKQIVHGIFAAAPYYLDLLATYEKPMPYIEENAAICKAFRPKSAIKPAAVPS